MRVKLSHQPRTYWQTRHGRMMLGDSLDVLAGIESGSVNLIMTSPPYALNTERPYGNVTADEYNDWFRPFAHEFMRVLAENGSLVIDIGGTWNRGIPTRHLYQFKLLIMLCDEIGFHLAEDFYWWNPASMPATSWVTTYRIRVKTSVETVWWLAKTPWPKASNRRVMQPYTPDMLTAMASGVLTHADRSTPSGMFKSSSFAVDHGGAIPPNLISVANNTSRDEYSRYCRENNLPIHPARYPATLPEYFIRMLTDRDDLVFDPFAGSCITGAVAERLRRRWLCAELCEEYLQGAVGRFDGSGHRAVDVGKFYQAAHPGALWNGIDAPPLAADGGRGHQRSRIRQRMPLSKARAVFGLLW